MKRILSIVGGSFLSTLLWAQVAVIHEDITEFECTGANSGTLHKKIVYTVNDSRGENLCNWSFNCEKGFIELKKFEGYVTEGNGKITKFKKGDLLTSEYSNNLADDDYFYYLSPRTSSYPIHITYEFEVSFNSLLAFPTFSPVPTFDVSVDSAVYRLITTNSNEVRYKALNFEPQIKSYDDKKGKHVQEISVSHLPAIKYYKDGLSLNAQSPIVYFAPTQCTYKGMHCDLSDWKTYGQWSYDLNKDRDALPQELAQKLHEMTDTCSTLKSKVGVVRDFLGKTTRYVNIVLGIGGYQTRKAADVYKTGVGDCKALSNYFCAMLRELGIPAVYTLIGNKELLSDMPNFQQLNHVIVQVPLPQDTLWVECTNAKYPFNYCPSSHRGHHVILVTEQGGILSQIPERKDEENYQKEVFDVTIDEDGDASLSLHRYTLGESFESHLWMLEARKEDIQKSVTNPLHLPHPTIQDLSVEKQGSRIDLNLKAESLGWARTSGSRLFVPISPYTYASVPNVAAHVIDLVGDGFIEETEIRLKLPEQYNIESIPESQTIESQLGKYEISIQKKDNEITILSHFHINSGKYEADNYPEWIKFRKQIANLSKKNITLIKKAQ